MHITCVKYDFRTIASEENCSKTSILTLTLNQTPTLTGGQFSSGNNCPGAAKYIYSSYNHITLSYLYIYCSCIEITSIKEVIYEQLLYQHN